MNEKTFELEERLINFSVTTIASIEKLPENRIAIYLSNQTPILNLSFIKLR